MSQPADGVRATEARVANREAEHCAVGGNRVWRVVFATDGSNGAEAARRFLGLLPLPPGSAVEVVTVIENLTMSETPLWYLEAGSDWGTKTAERARHSLAWGGVETSSSVRSGARPHQIIQAAEEFEADLLVLGSEGLSGLAAFLLGTVAQSVAQHANCSVLVAREPRNDLRRVALAVDESEQATRAVDMALDLPLPPESQMKVITVVPHHAPFPGIAPDDPVGFRREVESIRRQRHRDGNELVERVADRFRAAGRNVAATVAEGDAAANILKLADEERADLIIAGARGVSLIRGLLVGSVADRLLKNARCSILLVR